MCMSALVEAVKQIFQTVLFILPPTAFEHSSCFKSLLRLGLVCLFIFAILMAVFIACLYLDGSPIALFLNSYITENDCY